MFFGFNIYLTAQVELILKISFFIYIFWFVYSLLNSLSLVGIIIRLGQKKADFDDLNTGGGTPSPNREFPILRIDEGGKDASRIIENVSAPSKLGITDRVKVPVWKGLANHHY
jgi:hypothetical protein